ncbi:MAG: universal stress protein [Deltaproteobacteria bacterium]|nr:universal stress protein [Deltaproteobacteria bacterium]
MNVETILVPTDFSAEADAAIPVAFRMARSHGARVVLAHVIEGFAIPNPLYPHYSVTLSPQEHARIEDEVRRALGDRVPAEYRKEVPWETLLASGQPASELARLAEEVRASLIVISSHGRTGLRRLALGSVAERVLHLWTGSILILR